MVFGKSFLWYVVKFNVIEGMWREFNVIGSMWCGFYLMGGMW